MQLSLEIEERGHCIAAAAVPPALLQGVASLTSGPTRTHFLAPRNAVRRHCDTNKHTMANRLSQIATRTGDNGTTGLGDNTRVSKDSLRVHAMGDVDELNSQIGVLLCEEMPADVRQLLVEVQHQLFNLGGELSIPGFELLKPEAVLVLDQALETYNATLPRLAEFILPAGSRAAALAHVCRTVARRAERAVVSLDQAETLKESPRLYLNRLSDLLFVLSRVLNRMNGGDDVYWKSERMARAGAE
jgi:cob(I)alamin adenosyltransferase